MCMLSQDLEDDPTYFLYDYLKIEVYNAEDDITEDDIKLKTFYLDLISDIIRHFRDLSRGAPENLGVQTDTFALFKEKIMPRVEAFARTDSEARVLLATLLKTLLDHGLRPFYHELQREKHENPELIFQAPSATSEVPL